jgi:hypothetical protein
MPYLLNVCRLNIKKESMKYPGYWVHKSDDSVVLVPFSFDETELDPKKNWTEAWQNSDEASLSMGFVELTSALKCAEKWLRNVEPS